MSKMANEKRLIDANALQLEPDPWGGMNGVLFMGRATGKTLLQVKCCLKAMIDNAPTVDAVPLEQYNELKERYKRLLETADILDAALRVYQRKYGDLEVE